MKALIVDIETIGESFEAIDPGTQELMTKRIRSEATSEEHYAELLAQLKKEMGLSPLTGETVAIGVLDYQTNISTVWYSAPGTDTSQQSMGNATPVPATVAEESVTYIQTTEEEMLRAFWNMAKGYDTFVTFAGWQFDVPFLNVRSAIHRIKPTRNLMTNRFLNNQRNGTFHIDLQDQLGYYGATRKKGSLHMWCRAFGIESPKTGGVLADDVAALYAEGKYLDIARYNARDIKATKELFDVWDAYLHL